jgi:hypothetical protein
MAAITTVTPPRQKGRARSSSPTPRATALLPASSGDEAVERLQAALAADGFLPVRDRDQMRSGERTSAFIRRLTHADETETRSAMTKGLKAHPTSPGSPTFLSAPRGGQGTGAARGGGCVFRRSRPPSPMEGGHPVGA